MRIKNMPRFLTFLIILFIAISCITSMFLNKVFSHEVEKFESITVCQGETLWSIADKMGGNISKNIYEIKKLNNLKDSVIYAGQELLIPESIL